MDLWGASGLPWALHHFWIHTSFYLSLRYTDYMMRAIKKRLYFWVARYFAFWARIKLLRWSPRVIVITGSAGKTTLLHLVEAQLGKEAHYSHHANSAFGIPFDILGLKGIQRSRADWFTMLLAAPFKTLTKTYPERFYVAEVDADRPREGKFLAHLLRPEVTLWVSSLHTHTAQFDKLVAQKKFSEVEDAVAAEYGNLVAAARKLAVVNGDNSRMVARAKRTAADVRSVSLKDLKRYQLGRDSTTFAFGTKTYTIPALQPRHVFYQVAMADALLTYLDKKPDLKYQKFSLPPGRSSVFEGLKQTTLIDSTYNNASIDSLTGVVEMFEDYPAKTKWLVLSDLIEQGANEAREHVKIADVLGRTHFQHIVLLGPRLKQYTVPALSAQLQKRSKIFAVTDAKEVSDILQENLTGGEAILFKGVRYLDTVIEQLLANPDNVKHLVRRDALSRRQRAKKGI